MSRDTPPVLEGRARGVWGPAAHAVIHLVPTDPHTGPAPTALCGRTPRRGWVMLPSGPLLERCAPCIRKADRL